MDSKDKNINELSDNEILKEAFVNATLREVDSSLENCEETSEVSDAYKKRANKMFKDMGSSFVPYPEIEE